jgi:hypothetical protein
MANKFRIYSEKTNTIASGVYSLFNSGQNAVTDLWYGGGGTDTALERRNSISRFMIKFDLTDFQSKLQNKEINQNLVAGYRLKMKNSIPKDKILEPEYEFDILNKNISASFDLICFPINKDWDEGRGYDLSRENYLVRQQGNPLITGYSNWDYSTTTTSWDEPGIYSNPTASTAVTMYSIQHFDIGNEDIDMDITPMVNDWLSGGSTNNGLAIAYSRDFELISGDSRYVTSFFTKHTNTAYKPYIEVTYNQTFKDDRLNVTNNRPCRLFLYTFSGHNPVNFYSASSVSIQTVGGFDVYTGLTPTQIERGVYYVDIWMSAATKGQQYKDVWYDVTFSPGYDKQTYTQIFTIQDNYYFTNTPNVNNYALTTYGIDNNSILGVDNVIRVFGDLRTNFSTNVPKNSYDLQYRLVMNHQDEIVPWTSFNQAVLNKCLSNYFVLDTHWLLTNQTYEIQTRMSEMGTVRVLPETIKFRTMAVVDTPKTPLNELVSVNNNGSAFFYYGKFSGSSINASQLIALPQSVFTNDVVNTFYNIPSSLSVQYVYFAIPNTFAQPSDFRDSTGGCFGFNWPYIVQGSVIVGPITYTVYRFTNQTAGALNAWLCP